VHVLKQVQRRGAASVEQLDVATSVLCISAISAASRSRSTGGSSREPSSTAPISGNAAINSGCG